MLQQSRQKRLRRRQRRDHVADVARRRHVEFRPQPPGASAVVRHRHDCRQVERQFLQPSQHDGQAGSPADRNHFRIARPDGRTLPAGCSRRFQRFFASPESSEIAAGV